MKEKSHLIIFFIVFITMGAVFLISYNFPYLQAKLAPMTISGLILILVGAQIIREFIHSSGTKDASKKKDDNNLRLLLMEGAWMSGFVAAIFLFGFLVSIPIFSIAYMRSHGARWRTTFFVAVPAVIVIIVVFTLLLDFRLYPGLAYYILNR